MEFLVDLNKVEDVKEFARISSSCDADIMVSNIKRSFKVDGSSLMGLFSLDLSNPVVVNVSDKEMVESFKESVNKFVYKGEAHENY